MSFIAEADLLGEGEEEEEGKVLDEVAEEEEKEMGVVSMATICVYSLFPLQIGFDQSERA